MSRRQKYTATFSSAYRVLNSLHVPVSVGVFLYEAIGLYEGRRVTASKGEEARNCSLQQLAQWCACGIAAGLLGIDGGFIMGPLFLELGIHPQVIFICFVAPLGRKALE